MSAHLRILRALAIVVVVAACAKGVKNVPTVDPFVADEADFRARVRTVAVADVAFPDGLPDPAPIAARLDSLLDRYLHAFGYLVTRPQRREPDAWNGAVAEVGGLADSSGTRDAGRTTAAMTMLKRPGSVAFDAVLVPSVEVVEALFAAGRAEWDGTKESIKAGGAFSGFFSGSPEGKIAALSYRVTIRNENVGTFYNNAGGIELLSKLDGKDFIPVPRAELFRDVDKLDHAVKTAVEPLKK